MSDIDYKNGYALLLNRIGDVYFYSTKEDCVRAYDKIINAINSGDKITDVFLQARTVWIDDVKVLSYEPAAGFIQARYRYFMNIKSGDAPYHDTAYYAANQKELEWHIQKWADLMDKAGLTK